MKDGTTVLFLSALVFVSGVLIGNGTGPNAVRRQAQCAHTLATATASDSLRYSRAPFYCDIEVRP